jgi:hypothetical protein
MGPWASWGFVVFDQGKWNVRLDKQKFIDFSAYFQETGDIMPYRGLQEMAKTCWSDYQKTRKSNHQYNLKLKCLSCPDK